MVRRPVPDSLRAFCDEKLAALDARRQRRRLVPTAHGAGLRAHRAGRALVDFSSNDALGLAHDARVIDAAARALAEHGAGATASRLVSGDHPLFCALEERLARHKDTDAALVVGSGFLANAGTLPALTGPADLIVLDALAHASLHAGAALSRARVVLAPHNDLAAFERALVEHRGAAERCLVVTESVFSMDGDRAPLEALGALAAAHDAWLVVDDAHGFLVSPDEPPIGARADVVTGSLSKASGSYGGTVCGPRALIELLTSRARPLVYSTALPPSVVGAALAALDIAEAEPARCRRPHALARRFCAAAGLPEPASHIVPVLCGDEARALELMAALEHAGFLAVAIRPPTVPAGTSRVRLSFSAAHTDDDVLALAAFVRAHRECVTHAAAIDT